MRLSTRATYGIRAMQALTAHYGQGALMVREIAARYHLPATYLEQLMVPLRRRGLITATRGARGGYMLARSPSAITMLEIVETLEGPLQLADCSYSATCGLSSDQCAMYALLRDAGSAMRDTLACVTLAELSQRQCALTAADVPLRVE